MNFLDFYEHIFSSRYNVNKVLSFPVSRNHFVDSNVRDRRVRIAFSVNGQIRVTFDIKFRSFRYGCNPQLKFRGCRHRLRYARSTKQPFQSSNSVSVHVAQIGIV